MRGARKCLVSGIPCQGSGSSSSVRLVPAVNGQGPAGSWVQFRSQPSSSQGHAGVYSSTAVLLHLGSEDFEPWPLS